MIIVLESPERVLLGNHYGDDAQTALDNFLAYLNTLKKDRALFYRLEIGLTRKPLATFETGHQDTWLFLGRLGEVGQGLLATLLEKLFINRALKLTFVRKPESKTGTAVIFTPGLADMNTYTFMPVRIED